MFHSVGWFFVNWESLKLDKDILDKSVTFPDDLVNLDIGIDIGSMTMDTDGTW